MKFTRNIACISNGQETAVLVHSGKQAWVGSVFSNMANAYGIKTKVNPKDTKTSLMVSSLKPTDILHTLI